MALPEGLLEAVKNYLDITWEDSAGDTKLEGIIARGMSRLNEIAGVTNVSTNPPDPEAESKGFNFTVEDQPRSLLFEYCRYARSGGLQDWEVNYMSELISLQNREEVKAYVRETEAADV